MLHISELSKSYGKETLFDEVTFTVQKGEKVGLVGRNGSGKSTLFKIMCKEEEVDSGEVITSKNYRIGILNQHLKFTQDNVLDECLLALPADEQYDHYKAEKILFGLGFQYEDLYKNPHDFSGGQQIRINLAKLLLGNYQLLLLDEPTNYLDILGLRWLKEYLKRCPQEFILITHDREFMNSVCNQIMGIYRKGVKKVQGDTYKYFEQIHFEEEIHEKTRANQEKKKKEIERFVDKFRAKARQASMAQSRMKMLEKMPDLHELSQEQTLDFHFNCSPCPGKNMMNVSDLSFTYSADKDFLIKNLNLTIHNNSRIAIIGKNGKGKSTLLNLLAGELAPSQGSIEPHNELKKGHFGQTNILRLNENNTIEDEIYSVNPNLPLTNVRAICGTMMFTGDLAKKKVSVLSGGERARVLLGKILANPTNILLLDEPTNHLDQESVEALLDELDRYNGTVIIVTHSEMIIRKLAQKLIVFQEGECEFFEGDYDYFLDKVGWREEEGILPKSKKSRKVNSKEEQKKKAELTRQKNKEMKPIKYKMELLEKEISGIEEKIETNNKKIIELSESGAGDKIQKVSQENHSLSKQIDDLYEELEMTTQVFDDINEKYEQL